MISTSGHLISKFPEVRFHRTRICICSRTLLLANSHYVNWWQNGYFRKNDTTFSPLKQDFPVFFKDFSLNLVTKTKVFLKCHHFLSKKMVTLFWKMRFRIKSLLNNYKNSSHMGNRVSHPSHIPKNSGKMGYPAPRHSYEWTHIMSTGDEMVIFEKMTPLFRL